MAFFVNAPSRVSRRNPRHITADNLIPRNSNANFCVGGKDGSEIASFTHGIV
jgi:hypothetical protein